MKVKELIEKLAKQNPEADVILTDASADEAFDPKDVQALEVVEITFESEYEEDPDDALEDDDPIVSDGLVPTEA